VAVTARRYNVRKGLVAGPGRNRQRTSPLLRYRSNGFFPSGPDPEQPNWCDHARCGLRSLPCGSLWGRDVVFEPRTKKLISKTGQAGGPPAWRDGGRLSPPDRFEEPAIGPSNPMPPRPSPPSSVNPPGALDHPGPPGMVESAGPGPRRGPRRRDIKAWVWLRPEPSCLRIAHPFPLLSGDSFSRPAGKVILDEERHRLRIVCNRWLRPAPWGPNAWRP